MFCVALACLPLKNLSGFGMDATPLEAENLMEIYAVV